MLVTVSVTSYFICLGSIVTPINIGQPILRPEVGLETREKPSRTHKSSGLRARSADDPPADRSIEYC